METEFRALVTGSRFHEGPEVVAQALSDVWIHITGPFLVVVGDCPTGADKHARDWCFYTGVPFRQYRAYWNVHGRRAGPIRNIEMVDIERPNICLAFFWPGSLNAGTKHCADYAKRRGIEVVEYH